jgi:hypothetical protein
MIEKPKLINANQSEPVRPHIQLDRDWVMNWQATYVQDLLKGYGLVAAKPGKCHNGFQESVLLEPKEVVGRACDLAEVLFNEFASRGWLLKVPLYDEIVEQLRDEAPSSVGFVPKVAAER